MQRTSHVQGCSKALLSESHTVIIVYFFEIPLRSVRETGQDVLFPVYRRHHVQRDDRMIFSVPVGREGWSWDKKPAQDIYSGHLGACLVSVPQHSAP